MNPADILRMLILAGRTARDPGAAIDDLRRRFEHMAETSHVFHASEPENTIPYVLPVQEGGSRSFDENGNPVYHGGTTPTPPTPLEKLRALRLRVQPPAEYNPPQRYVLPPDRKGN